MWRKVDLDLNGNIVGYERSAGPKKLLVFGSANVQAAVQDFSSVGFHARYLLPFYDRYLKGIDTGWECVPDVRWLPIKLVLHASSSNPDTDFIVKLSEQFAQDELERTTGADAPNPRYQIVTKGWLRASHRQLDPRHSTEYAPWYSHSAPTPLVPNKGYEFAIALMPTAHRFRAASRIRLEIAHGDSSVTEFVFAHEYAPWKIGADTIYHDARRASRLFLPVIVS